MKQFITILRKWNHPQIHIWISDEEIGLKMSIEDFKEALKKEIGSVTWVFRKESFEKMLDNAINQIISDIKKESAKIM